MNIYAKPTRALKRRFARVYYKGGETDLSNRLHSDRQVAAINEDKTFEVDS